MEKCSKEIAGTDLRCGQRAGVYCSDECARLVGASELAELGITQEMLSEALAGYYECKKLIDHRPKQRPPDPS